MCRKQDIFKWNYQLKQCVISLGLARLNQVGRFLFLSCLQFVQVSSVCNFFKFAGLNLESSLALVCPLLLLTGQQSTAQVDREDDSGDSGDSGDSDDAHPSLLTEELRDMVLGEVS